MARYLVSMVQRPTQWKPVSWDDAPPETGKARGILGESDDLFVAVRLAVEHNETAEQHRDVAWGVVLEQGTPGRICAGGRLCTPLTYRVAAIWWPTGWEPLSPLDVPNCVWKAHNELGQERLSYPQALATVQGLNRQCMDHPGSMWYVLVAVENEPVSETVSCDAAGTETTVIVRRLHVIRPESEGGKGDCSCCPAHDYPCAQESWASLPQTVTSTTTRSRS